MDDVDKWLNIIVAIVTIVSFILGYVFNITRKSELSKLAKLIAIQTQNEKLIDNEAISNSYSFEKIDALIERKKILTLGFQAGINSLAEFIGLFMFLLLFMIGSFLISTVVIYDFYVSSSSILTYILIFFSIHCICLSILFLDTSINTKYYSRIALLEEVVIIHNIFGQVNFLSLPCHFYKNKKDYSKLIYILTLGLAKFFCMRQIVLTDKTSSFKVLSFSKWQNTFHGTPEIDEFNKKLNRLIRWRYKNQ